MQNKKNAELPVAKVGKKIVNLGTELLDLPSSGVSNDSKVDAYVFLVNLGVGLEGLLKSYQAYANNPRTGTFIDLKISSQVLVSHLASDKFVKGFKSLGVK
ncbi:hypothetical protein EBR96_11260 [bacterium]|nr:hypothetical protein [bacterium]